MSHSDSLKDSQPLSQRVKRSGRAAVIHFQYRAVGFELYLHFPTSQFLAQCLSNQHTARSPLHQMIKTKVHYCSQEPIKACSNFKAIFQCFFLFCFKDTTGFGNLLPFILWRRINHFVSNFIFHHFYRTWIFQRDWKWRNLRQWPAAPVCKNWTTWTPTSSIWRCPNCFALTRLIDRNYFNIILRWHMFAQKCNMPWCRSQWPLVSETGVRIPMGTWVSVSYVSVIR